MDKDDLNLRPALTNETTLCMPTTLQDAHDWVKAQKAFEMIENASLRPEAGDVTGLSKEFLYFGNHAQTA